MRIKHATTPNKSSRKNEKNSEKESFDTFCFPAPNYTQSPNIAYDEIMGKITGAEWKVLSKIIRETFGWHRNVSKITLKDFEKSTGLTRKHVISGINKLLNKGLIKKRKKGPKNRIESYYEIVVNDKKYSSKKVSEYPFDTSQGYPFDTPPIYKDIKEKKGKERATAPTASPPRPIPKSKKLKFSDHVRMTQAEYNSLCNDKTKERADEYIQRLNDYAEVKEKRFKEYTNHAIVIRQWMKRDDEKPMDGTRVSKNIQDKNREMVSKLSKQSQELQGIFKIHQTFVEVGESTGAYAAPCFNFDDKDFRRKIEEWLFKRNIKFYL